MTDDVWGQATSTTIDVGNTTTVPLKEGKKLTTTVEQAFKKAGEIQQKKGLKIGIYGPTSTGKTHFAMTAPGPVFIIDTELGSASIAKRFEGKDINISEIFSESDDEIWERDDVESYEKIKQAINAVYRNTKEGTIVVDSGTDLWSLCQSYSKVKIFKLRPEDRLKFQFDWGKINNIYLQMITKLLATPHNLVFTGRNKEIYNGTTPSGQFEASWQGKTEYFLDVIIENKVIMKAGKATFLSEIIKCRPNGELKGKIYENLTFDKLKQELNGGLKA